MASKSLAEWLAWQETLNTAEIDLGLDRVREVCARLAIHPPEGGVLTVAGTNGKGSCASVLEVLTRTAGLRTGLYTSPHLVHYNERIRVNNAPAEDGWLTAAFERIEAVRDGIPLTFFEYGTLAAFQVFTERCCDVWVLEIGLGGRLDAVNVIDPDVAIITTVALDHQAWLGDTIEQIAREKAGILRAGRPGLFGDEPVPASVRDYAAETDAELRCYREDFSATVEGETWSWQGQAMRLSGLPIPQGYQAAQLRNQAVALAALECALPEVITDAGQVATALSDCNVPGRMQEYQDEHRWLLDVAHNTQAAGGLADWLRRTGEGPVTVVVGMLADKQADDFALALQGQGVPIQWVTCPVDARRGRGAHDLADRLAGVVAGAITPAETVIAALSEARDNTPVGGRIVVCGSFYIVGPALSWLGLY